MPRSSVPTPCTPTPDQEPRLLAALDSPTLSLREIAETFNTTTESLALWMALPEITARLSYTDSITTWRTRLLAQQSLIKVVATCSKILDEFNANLRFPLNVPAAPASATPSEHPASATPNSASTDPILLYIRRAESARRAASLLVRLSRLCETTRTHRPTDRSAADLSPHHPAPNSTRPERTERDLRAIPQVAQTPIAHARPTHVPRPPEPATPAPLPRTSPPRHDRPNLPIPNAPSPLNPAPNRNHTFRPPRPLRSPHSLLTAAGASPQEHWP